MKNGRLKNSITSLFLVLFISMKMAGLHVLFHSDDKDHAIHCTVCDHAIVHNLNPALTPDLPDFTIENPEFVVQRECIKNYHFIALNNLSTGLLFSRPPPSLL